MDIHTLVLAEVNARIACPASSNALPSMGTTCQVIINSEQISVLIPTCITHFATVVIGEDFI